MLSGSKIKHGKLSRSRIHFIDNVNIVLQHLEKESKIKLVNIHAIDIVNGSHRIILALIWAIILNFFVAKLRSLQFKFERVPVNSLSSQVSVNEPSPEEDGHLLSDAKNLLINNLIDNFGLIGLNNLEHDFKDGRNILLMLDKFRPNLDLITKGNQIESDYERLKFALNCAEHYLSIGKLIDEDDIYRDQPEIRSLIVYLYQYLEKSRDLFERELDDANVDDEEKQLLTDKCNLIKNFIEKVDLSHNLGEFKAQFVELNLVFGQVSDRLSDDELRKWMAIERKLTNERQAFLSKLESSLRSRNSICPNKRLPTISECDSIYRDKCSLPAIGVSAENSLTNDDLFNSVNSTKNKNGTVDLNESLDKCVLVKSNSVRINRSSTKPGLIKPDLMAELNQVVMRKSIDYKANSKLSTKQAAERLTMSEHHKQLIKFNRYLDRVLKENISIIYKLTMFISFPLCFVILLPLLIKNVYFCRC